MSERSLNLLAQLGGIDEQYIDEAGEDIPAKKKIHWLRWTALAACLAVVIVGGGILTGVIPGLPIGGNTGGSGVDPAAEGPSTFMSYAGPVFPLTLREENDAVTAERNVTLDFAPWEKVWDDRLELWRSSSDILVTDAYTLTNTGDENQTLTVLYPFAGGLISLDTYRPALTVDGEALETTLYGGGYVGGYMGAVGGDLVTPAKEGSVNLRYPDSWEDYRDALAGGTYLQNALGDYPDLSGMKATVYEFTDPWGEPEDDEAGVPNPTIRAWFTLDYSRTAVLSTGFNGGKYDRDNGMMGREFSILQPGETGFGEDCRRLIVVGDDIRDLTTRGYVTGGWDDDPTIEAGVTVTRRETDLEDALRQTAQELFADRADDERMAGVDFEMFFGLFKVWLITDGPLSERSVERYDSGQLEENEVLDQNRVFWLEAEVTIPAGGSVELAASMRKAASCDFYCAHTENQGVRGYDLTTRLGSNLNCAAQTATLEDRGQIVIVRQNYGFDLAGGIRTVPLTEEEYYLEVKRPPEG